MTDFILNLFSSIAHAACGPQLGGGYILCTPLPGVSGAVSGPAEYIQTLYNFGLGISGILAFGLIVWGGINYMWASGNVSKQGEAKEMILSAIYGLILLLSAILILQTISPSLTVIKDIDLTPIPKQDKIDVFNAISPQMRSLITDAAQSGDPAKYYEAYEQIKKDDPQAMAAFVKALNPEQLGKLATEINKHSTSDSRKLKFFVTSILTNKDIPPDLIYSGAVQYVDNATFGELYWTIGDLGAQINPRDPAEGGSEAQKALLANSTPEQLTTFFRSLKTGASQVFLLKQLQSTSAGSAFKRVFDNSVFYSSFEQSVIKDESGDAAHELSNLLTFKT